MQQGFQNLRRLTDRLHLVAEHVNPWGRIPFASQVKRLADAVSRHETLIEGVDGLLNLAHGLPLDALASLAACAAAGLALALLESGQLVELPFSLLVESLLFCSGELGGLPPG